MTYDELLRIAPLDNLWHEIIDGEHVARGGAEIPHQRALLPLGEAILRPLDVVLSPVDVLHPDIFYVRNERKHIWNERGTSGPPDLAIEIVDNESRRRDEIAKRRAYEQFGVSEYWIVDPEADHVIVYRLADGRYGEGTAVRETLTTPLLPGLEIDLAKRFAAQ